MTPNVAERRGAFARLHASGCFVMPNAWDEGSARLLVQLGFPAIATTSSGFAWTQGCADSHVPLPRVVAHLEVMAAAVDVPLSADFEGAYAVEPDDVLVNVTAAVRTGVAGLSIEDSTGDPSRPLLDTMLAVERVRAARQAVDLGGAGAVLTARSEGFVVGRPDLGETIRRLTAYAEAGADCVFAPGLRSADDITAVVRAVAPTPVNVLAGSGFTTVRALAALGVRRISVGGALARTAWTAALAAATEIAQHGTFTAFDAAVPFAEFNGRFR